MTKRRVFAEEINLEIVTSPKNKRPKTTLNGCVADVNLKSMNVALDESTENQ